MNVRRWIAPAWGALRRHRLRSFLIFLTFVLGFASVLGTIATVEGGRRTIRNSLENLGTDVIVVFAEYESALEMGLAALMGGGGPLNQKVANELRDELAADARQVIPLNFDPSLLERRSESTKTGSGSPAAKQPKISTLTVATESGFPNAVRTGMLAGEFFPADAAAKDGVWPAVLDEALAREIDADEPESLVGERMILQRGGAPVTIEIRGILKDPILLRSHLNVFDQAAARAVTARRLVFKSVYVPYQPKKDSVRGILVQANSVDEIEALGDRLLDFFDSRKIEVSYAIQKEWIEHVSELIDRFQYLTHFLWVLDLLVMVILTGTITLMAIEERYVEIALRRVEGARVVDVVLPLVLEGITLAVVAIPFGYYLGLAIVKYYVTPILQWKPILPMEWLAWIAPILVAVGALTNLMPAWKAARLSPARVLSDRG